PPFSAGAGRQGDPPHDRPERSVTRPALSVKESEGAGSVRRASRRTQTERGVEMTTRHWELKTKRGSVTLDATIDRDPEGDLWYTLAVNGDGVLTSEELEELVKLAQRALTLR